MLRANAIGKASRSWGAPHLSLESGISTLRDWLGWCDPNGEWLNDSCAELTAGEAWDAIAEMTAEEDDS